MPLAKVYNTFSENVQNKIWYAVIVIVALAAYTMWTPYRSDVKVAKLEKEVAELQNENTELRIELATVEKEKFQLEIELLKCRVEYEDISSDFNDLPVPYWRQDIKSGYITYCNDAYVEQVLIPMGLKRYDMLFRPLEEVFGKKYADGFKLSFDRVVKTGIPETLVEQSMEKGKIINWRSTKYLYPRVGKPQGLAGVAYKLN